MFFDCFIVLLGFLMLDPAELHKKKSMLHQQLVDGNLGFTDNFLFFFFF